MNNRDILIVVDVQNDFCPGGALAVKEGNRIVPVINGIMDRFQTIAATQDWHTTHHASFASSHPGKKPYEQIDLDGARQTLWPDHCVAGTAGAAFHPSLRDDRFNLIVRKGTNPSVDSYSAFLENDRKIKTGLDGYLKAVGAERLFLCGLATDYCVFFSAMDAADFGFTAFVILDACRGIDVPDNNIDRSIAEMKKKGIRIISAGDLPNFS